MDDTTGRSTSPLINDLLSRGHDFSFNQIMRIARKHFGPGGPEELPGVHWLDRLSVRPDLSLAFPAADVVRVERTGKDDADLLVTTTFLGLYGTSSPLPTHYTEDLMDEAAADSSVSRDFLDLLHQRLYQLYFECWSKYRLCIRLVEEKNPRDWERLFSLIGLGETELRDGMLNSASLLRYIGLFNQSPRSALGLQTLLRDALGVRKLEVEQCVLRRVPIPEDQQLRLGIANMCLGVNTFLGSETADRMGKFRIHIGPLSKEEFDTFLPGTPRHDQLARFISFYIVDPFDFDLKITMVAGEAQPIRLGDADGPRLGWNSWCFSGDTLGEVSAVFPLANSAAKTYAAATDDFGSMPERKGPSTLVDHYQEELARLRDLAANYAKAHPALASMVTGNPADRSVERLFEGVAFLNANLQIKLNDDFPEIVHELTEALHPWDLRPVPATTIVAFTPKAEFAQPQFVAAGAEIVSMPVQGVKCRFKTCFDVALHPLRLLHASFSHPPGKAPSIRVQCQLNGLGLSQWQPQTLRFFLGDDYPAASDLYLLLMRYLKRVVITSHDNGAAIEIAADCLRPVGFADNEAMLAKEPHGLPGHKILQEYFLFQDKFLFVDLCGLDGCRTLGEGYRFEISFELTACQLIVPQVNAKSFVLFATPVINLFEHKAKPVAFADDEVLQRLLPSGKEADHCHIYSVDLITDFYAAAAEKRTYASHAPLLQSLDFELQCHVTRNESPLGEGFETFISVPPRSRKALPSRPKLNVDLTCTDGILPELLNIGDLCIPTSAIPESTLLSNIKPVTSAIHPGIGQNLQWRLLSSHSLNRAFLDAVENLRAMLRLFISLNDRNQATVKANLKRVESIASIDAKPADRLICRSMHRGYEIRMKLRGEHFAGSGDLYLFSSVLERFLGGYVTQSCFIRLIVEEISKGQTFKWPARLGDRPLI